MKKKVISLRIIAVFLIVLLLASCQSARQKLPVIPFQELAYFANQPVDNSRVLNGLAPLRITPTFLKGDGLSDRVQFWVNYFTKRDRSRFIRFLQNGNSYRGIVEETFQAQGLPKDIYFLGLIESGYQLTIKSRAKAVGPWQFIADTARRYGLRVDNRIDERRSLAKSTEAAARYLKHLFQMFGSWELAVAGYNAGENRIFRAIQEGDTIDYHKICRDKLLPKETCNYVAKILAVKIIDDNLDYFSLEQNMAQAPGLPNMKFYHVTNDLSVNEVAQRSGLSSSDIKLYNPDILSHLIKVNRGTYRLYLPAYAYDRFITNHVKTKNVSPSSKVARYHVVRHGETLSGIATKYQVAIDDLIQANSLLKQQGIIHPRQKLSIPIVQ